jgi:nitrite reductase/ring-hydroxylating ferredoxin subunit
MSEKHWQQVARLQDLSPGVMIAIEVDGRDIALYRLESGEVYATDNICTHGFARLTEGFLDDDIVECPLHAGQFNVRTGEGLCAPIMENLKTFELRVSEDVVYLCVPAA